MTMESDAENSKPRDFDSADDFADRMQAIDEQIADEIPEGEATISSDSADGALHDTRLNRVKNVFQLIHRLRIRDCEADFDDANDRASDEPSQKSFDHLSAGLGGALDREPQAEFAQTGFEIGNYVVEDEIARGGMGIVFRARDSKLNRRVALKILRAGPLARDEDRIRFRGEAEAAARLDHPGIVPVYEVGDQNGMLYFTMGMVDGPSLSNLILQSPLEPTRAADIAKQIAEAADYAHQRGVVHRDLKPSNVLFDERGRVRVADFGLARRTDSGSDLTETGQVVGTPEYMAPEQAAGNASTAGPSADIYSIGATLYCMLTGQPPFRSSSSIETLRKVLEQDPISVRKFNRWVPADLETICLRCLEKQPTKRYHDAASLAQDLGRFLIGEPIEARRPNLAERAIRWSRRHPLAASLVGLLLLLAIIGPIIATSQMRLAREARQARDAMARTLYISDMNLAMRDWEQANLHRLGELLTRHVPVADQQDYRGFEWYYLWKKWKQGDDLPVVLQDDQVESIAISPDNQTLAVGCFDGRLILWDLDNQCEMHSWKAHPYRTYRLSFSHDSKRLASASIDNEVSIWDVQTGGLVRRQRGSRAVCFSPTDNSFAHRTQGGSIHIHHSLDAEPVLVEAAESEFIEALTYSGDGTQIASAGWDKHIRLWNASTGVLEQTLDGHPHTIWSLAWSPTGPLLVSGDVNGIVQLWNTESKELYATFSSHRSAINALAFSPDGELFASASADNTVELREVAGGRLVEQLKVHSAEVTGVAFSDDGRSLVTASIDGTIKQWTLDGRRDNEVLEHPELVTSVDFFPDGKQIASACYDGKIRCWRVADGELVREFVAHQNSVWRVRIITLDGQTLILTSGADSAFCIWNADTGDLIRKLEARPDSGDPLAFAVSPDRHRVAFSKTKHVTCIWDLKKDRQVATFESTKVEDIDFSADGNYLYAASGTSVSLHDAKTGERLRQWPGGSRSVTRLLASPDGRMVVAGTHSRLVKIWDSESLLNFESDLVAEPIILTGSAGIIAALASFHDCSAIASAGDDEVIRLWDTKTGQQRAALIGHTSSVVDLAFSPDDQVLASASLDYTVRLWHGPKTVVTNQAAIK